MRHFLISGLMLLSLEAHAKHFIAKVNEGIRFGLVKTEVDFVFNGKPHHSVKTECHKDVQEERDAVETVFKGCTDKVIKDDASEGIWETNCPESALIGTKHMKVHNTKLADGSVAGIVQHDHVTSKVKFTRLGPCLN